MGMEKWLGKKGQANLAHVVEYDVLLKEGVESKLIGPPLSFLSYSIHLSFR